MIKENALSSVVTFIIRNVISYWHSLCLNSNVNLCCNNFSIFILSFGWNIWCPIQRRRTLDSWWGQPRTVDNNLFLSNSAFGHFTLLNSSLVWKTMQSLFQPYLNLWGIHVELKLALFHCTVASTLLPCIWVSSVYSWSLHLGADSICIRIWFWANKPVDLMYISHSFLSQSK